MGKNEFEYKGVQRYAVVNPRDCSFGVITNKKLSWTEHTVQIVNVSILGIGIESDEKITPGLVWFKKRVSGYKCGVLRWFVQSDNRYRGGIEFISLSRHMEEYLQKQIKHHQPHKPISDPEQIIAELIEANTK
ncbi:MAG TPA: hypothetical protein VLX29_10390 [Nitrospirota bacterium]|nr:hypothetical protein [Nitrospirota bacterium]